jgi:hypothetical protein
MLSFGSFSFSHEDGTPDPHAWILIKTAPLPSLFDFSKTPHG